jgi:hypothetical protein
MCLFWALIGLKISLKNDPKRPKFDLKSAPKVKSFKNLQKRPLCLKGDILCFTLVLRKQWSSKVIPGNYSIIYLHNICPYNMIPTVTTLNELMMFYFFEIINLNLQFLIFKITKHI